MTELDYAALETLLQPLATPMGKPQAGDWLADHFEKGQDFRAYLKAKPIRRDATWTTIYIVAIGDWGEAHEQIVQTTCAYLGLFFDVPVLRLPTIPISSIPASAKRKHPTSGDKQLLTKYLLNDVLEPTRPPDALAYMALTVRDLTPGHGWNFVFGEANLRDRIGVTSLYRNGYPGPTEDAFRLCLRRTLLIAAHEIGHMLTMHHCTAYRCLMNGCNSQEERDRQPLHPCPVCLRKTCWNLQVEPAPYVARLAEFCATHGLIADAEWFAEAEQRLRT